MSSKNLFVSLMLIALLWGGSRVVTSAFQERPSDSRAHVAVLSEKVSISDLVQPAPEPLPEDDEEAGWFISDEESQWAGSELIFVQQIMDRTWLALAGVGLDGPGLLAGYHFRRVSAEFLPGEYVSGEERLLAVVDHQKMEILLADGAFQRLSGFYIYHELGHVVDRQLERLPSEAYHRLAGADQNAATTGDEAWSTITGFWLRYHGRDDREEATADAFAWWVMAQFDQPKPFFPGTPVTTDYAEIAQTIESALATAATSGT